MPSQFGGEQPPCEPPPVDNNLVPPAGIQQQGEEQPPVVVTTAVDMHDAMAHVTVNNGPLVSSNSSASSGGSWRRRTKRAPQRVIAEEEAEMSADEELNMMLSPLRRPCPVDSDDELNQRLSPPKKKADSSSIADSTSGDVERFEGKIVYNPDGSAYIIEDSELSEEDTNLDLPLQLDGCIVDGRGVNLSQFQVFPQIANAFYVSRNPSLYSALYGQAYANILREKKFVPEVPVMHSYRVYTVRDKNGQQQQKIIKDPTEKSSSSSTEKDTNDDDVEKKSSTSQQLDCSSVPIKPILMCFICKLSFGYAKSFVSHAMSDHSLVLLDDEKEILNHKNTSAIIQCVGKDKEPLVSFLEPLSPVLGRLDSLQRPPSPSVSAAAAAVAANAMKTLMAVSGTLSLPTNTTVSTSSHGDDEHQVQESSTSLNVSHGMDLTRKSPGGLRSNSTSPGASPSPQFNSPLPPPPPTYSTSNLPQPPNFLTGTTIGVCPDHMTGRPSGVECAKCEMILNSSRLGHASGQGGLLAGIHSRNSCKTLKCPKCNWHYKYQETLEIHMKEKHPESETSCIYCIAGQPHPRLARGETYTCGYKPYRCEVCNYSTTTKGNLSIHMQSDKHLNNMQELQNGGVPNTENTHQSTPSPASHKAMNLVTTALSPPSNSGTPVRETVPSSPVSSSQSNKPKPTFRCDVCNYETNVARNLRIHMTSEKHTHNMMVLQQNVKHMQQLSALQQAAQSQMAAAAAGGGFDPATAAALLHFHPGLTLQGDKPPPHTEAALADMAYNQALLIQMMTGGQLPPHVPPELAPHMDLGLNPDTMEPPPEPPDQNPSFLFQCCVCTVFSTDSLEALSHHLAQDRTKLREQEILALVGGNYVCKLCTYKTNLKANFQLHCKTDKHLQRLQHVNHIKEGGNRNEWKLKYVSVSNPVQIRCHACDYYTNSAHKLQLHAAHQRHEVSRMVFRHLASGESSLRDTEPRIYHCALCGFSSRAKLPLLQHVRSMKHLQMEQLHQLQRRSEGKEPHTDIGEVFQVVGQAQLDASMQQQLAAEVAAAATSSSIPESPTDRSKERRGSTSSQSGGAPTPAPADLKDPASMLKFALEGQNNAESSADETSPERSNASHSCPYCNFSSTSEMRIQAHVLAQHSAQLQQDNNNKPDFLCPLCQDGFKEKGQLERHVMQIHSVNAEGLQRLLLLVDQSHWLNSRQESATDLSKSEEQDGDDSEPMDLDQESTEDLKCGTCNKMCNSLDELCFHQTETGHLELKQTPNGPGYLCWKKGCNQYFNSAISLQNHYREIHAVKIQAPAPPMAAVSEKHVYKYRCNQCSLAFKTLEKLQLHSQYHLIRDATKCMLCGRSFRSVLALQKHVETSHSELSDEELNQYKQSLMNNPLFLAGLGAGTGSALEAACSELMKRASANNEEPTSPIDEDDEQSEQADENSNDSIVYKEQQFLEDYLNSQAIAEDSYNDPNRKYKCHRCKVAFTRQSYLTSHNKTLLHRKGEKLSYPMEKYLDPNRPYKCDVCKESFTQKNILLVHYNSVSHLHKLKRAMQDQHGSQNNNNNVSTMHVSKSISSPEEDDKKPYKCNICKVAYTQGSTLDIHMRSVLHQTRASKLQELALTGQIDLSRPLIEQPEHKKIMQDMNSPKQISPNSRTSPSNTESPNSSQLTSPPSSSSNTTVPTTPNNSSLQISAVTPTNSSIHACPRCNALFSNAEQLSQHQQLYCMFQNPLALFPALPGASSPPQPHKTPSPAPTTPTPTTPLNSSTPQQLLHLHGLEDPFSKMAAISKKPSQMYKHLLESYGFELVMQFNENHQRRVRRELRGEEEEKPPAVVVPQEEPVPVPPTPAVISTPDTTTILPEEDTTLPEVAKSTCQHCKKEFSSVWVLKAHCEEVHRDLVPQEFLEKYAQQFKHEYEKKSSDVKTPETPESTPEKDEDNKEALAKLIQSTSVEVTATPPAPSTPTASSTPASSTDSVPPCSREQSMSLAQQMNEMQAALNAMAASQLQQLQFNPMMMGMMGMGLPLGLNMPALAAMNLQPPLVPMMMPPHFDPMSPLFNPAALDPQMMAKQQQMMQQQQTPPQQQQQQQPGPSNASVAAAAAANASQQKRARTRITDDQLKILRAHFDINNSPSEEQITDMASQSGLPPKVIKHWFRNTLFKERQRNKDSPYNFNNPPSTTLNLEEYEKTGEAKVMPLSSEEQHSIQQQSLAAAAKHKKPSQKQQQQTQQQPQPSSTPKPEAETVKIEPREEVNIPVPPPLPPTIQVPMIEKLQIPKIEPTERKESMEHQHEPIMKLLESGQIQLPDLPPPPRQSSSPSGLTLTSLIASQLGNTPTDMTVHNTVVTTSPVSSSSSNCSISGAGMLPPKMTPNFVVQTPTPSVLPPLPPSVSPGRSPGSNMDFQPQGGNSNGSSSSGGSSSGKRANRTRFTDYQIKVLQEFFENNAYPKDDDLEYLSKLLNLSPRVIVVWFQNARQKARKVYENQPQVETPNDDGTGRFQRTPGLNYQCKKCLLVFQRYYELIRHQKTHCFKEEDAKRSAQAQAAAAQIAAVLSSEDSNSSAEPGQVMGSGQPAPPAPSLFATSPVPPPPPPMEQQNRTKSPSASAAVAQEGTFQCDKCNLVFPRFDLWREHQLVHIMNPNLFPTYPPDSPFGILQQHAQLQQQQLQQAAAASLSCEGSDAGTPTPLQQQKRKLEEFEDDREDQPKDKRLRTTILPEQLDYLYQKYQIESNPSRKMLENIAREVGLKKRVVQVWFQNTRARERKGQFRAHAQVINKRCPFCPALFKVKSALESHLVTKHADQCTRGEINIDALPDEELSMESTSYTSETPKMSSFSQPNASTTPPAASMMPPIFPPFGHDMENSLKKYYEESMKRYISELQTHAQNNGQKESSEMMKIKQEGGECHPTGESPLDLSKPVDLSRPMKVNTDTYSEGPLTDVSLEEGLERQLSNRFLGDEARSDSMSETTDNFDDTFDESNPVSPASSTQSQLLPGSTPTGSNSSSSKRFRTQMSSVQVKVMKSLFNDYKTPTMAECEMLGHEIGLPKRVVQVWFQNARAKEKKNKLALQKAFGTEPDSPRPPEECKLCAFKYSHKYSIQDHIFTKKHIANVRSYIESGKCDISVNDTSFTMPPTPQQEQSSTGNQQQLAQLQMLQMAGLSGLPAPAMAAAVAAAMAAANNNKEPGKENSKEDMALLHQLYGLGLAGFPAGGQQQQQQQQQQGNNMFLHPSMFPAGAT
ncbi:hypothetical protein B566_EDAN004972, partial [Ephemera danica]